MTILIKKILFPVILFTAVFLIILHSVSKNQNNDNYIIKSYKNTVALYNGEKIIQIYDSIILNTLPQKDIQNFNSGISVSSPQEAIEYLNDFDN